VRIALKGLRARVESRLDRARIVTFSGGMCIAGRSAEIDS
jgi:hypothetical protein